MSNSCIDPIWEKVHSSQEWGAYPPEHVIRFVARNYYSGDRRNTRILDFGCGQGAVTWYLAREGFDVYAFDGSRSAIEKCSKRLSREDLNAKLEVLDALDLNYPDNFFDAVIDNACIGSNRLGHIKQMYRKAHDLLKPGGKLFSVVFGEECGGIQTGDSIEPGTYTNVKEGVFVNRGVVHIFNKDEMVELIRSVGYINVQCETSLFENAGYMVHHYICCGEKSE